MDRPLVYIEFLDHIGLPAAQTWVYLEDVPRDACIIRKIGWVIHENKQSITISGTVGEQIGESHPESFADYMVIIKKTITRRVPVTLA